MKHTAEWTDDCQGKKDFDGKVVLISTRYWPGRLTVYDTSQPKKGLHDITAGGPSAKSSLYINHMPADGTENGYGDHFLLAEKEFDAPTEAEVKSQVEVWVQEQFERTTKALRTEFNV
jgi:hypothetical protein